MYRMDRSLRLRKKTKERAKTNNPPEVCACIPSHIAHRKQTPQTVLWFSALTAVVSLSLRCLHAYERFALPPNTDLRATSISPRTPSRRQSFPSITGGNPQTTPILTLVPPLLPR